MIKYWCLSVCFEVHWEGWKSMEFRLGELFCGSGGIGYAAKIAKL